MPRLVRGWKSAEPSHQWNRYDDPGEHVPNPRPLAKRFPGGRVEYHGQVVVIVGAKPWWYLTTGTQIMLLLAFELVEQLTRVAEGVGQHVQARPR